MKNGTRYHMIRVTYESGQSTAPAPVTEDGQAVTTAGNTVFLWIVYGHRPDTDRPIYQPDDVTAQVLDQIGDGMFYSLLSAFPSLDFSLMRGQAKGNNA